MGGLDADLMLSPCFQLEAQFGDETFAAHEWIFRKDFVVSDGVAVFRTGSIRFRFGQDALAQLVAA
jgi:hypothetical protein